MERAAATAAWLVNTYLSEKMMPPSQRFGLVAKCLQGYAF
jgi:hypothetical protein